MAISSTLTTSFKKELLLGNHNFATNGDAYKLALYTSSATLGATTTSFTTTGQASGTNYSSGGGTLTKVAPTSSGTTAFTAVSYTHLTLPTKRIV